MAWIVGKTKDAYGGIQVLAYTTPRSAFGEKSGVGFGVLL